MDGINVTDGGWGLSETNEMANKLICRNGNNHVALNAQRIWFLANLLRKMHEKAGATLINQLEDILESSKKLVDRGLGRLVGKIINQGLIDAKTTYDPTETNREFVQKAKKIIETWQEKDEERFDYGEYIYFIKQRVEDF